MSILGDLGAGAPPKELASWPCAHPAEPTGRASLILHLPLLTGDCSCKVSHAPGSGPAFCLLPVPCSLPELSEKTAGSMLSAGPTSPSASCRLLDHCPCSFSGKRLVAWVRGSGLAALSSCSAESLRRVRLRRGPQSWVMSDFPPISTPSWTPNPLYQSQTQHTSFHPSQTFNTHNHQETWHSLTHFTENTPSSPADTVHGPSQIHVIQQTLDIR